MNDGISMVIQHLSQAIGLLAFLAGFAVFTLIFRITKDSAYLLLAMGMLTNLLIGVVYYVLIYVFDGAIAFSRGFLFQFLLPVIQLAGGLLLIIGFVMLGVRAMKKFRRPQGGPPALPPEKAAS